jgi:dTDP-4-dehydrorhamnose reductase
MANKKLKILITGANGQLGLCLKDISVEYPSNIYDFKTSNQLDITNRNQVTTLFLSENYDYCINCAAYTAVDKAESEKEQAYLVNAEAVKYIAEACKITNTVLIHISTDFVFDGTKDSPYTEEDQPNPINIYGASKLKGEQYVQDILTNYFIIRTSWVYSEHGNNFVKTMLRLANEKDEISVVNDQIGSPTYAGDLAAFIFKYFEENHTNFGIFHYSNEGEICWFDFAKVIFAINSSNVKVYPISADFYPTTAKRPKYSALDKLKTKECLNASIPFWEDSVKKCLKRIN